MKKIDAIIILMVGVILLLSTFKVNELEHTKENLIEELTRYQYSLSHGYLPEPFVLKCNEKKGYQSLRVWRMHNNEWLITPPPEQVTIGCYIVPRN